MKVERKKGLEKVKIHHNRFLFWTIIVLFLILLGVIFKIVQIGDEKSELNITPIENNNTKIANPASLFCIEHNGTLEIRTNNDGQYGVCVFEDKSECEEWAYFRGECNISSPASGSADTGCSLDSDCVPDSCCHASGCVLRNNAPDCSDKFCTLNCEPGTLDCGQGSCKCINNKCGSVIA